MNPSWWCGHDAPCTLFNPNPGTIEFLHHVLDEIIDLFPSPFIHIGGDEAAKARWGEDPAARARMKELGLADDDALYAWFIGQMADHLKSRGRKLIGWDEILDGGAPPGAAIMSWRGHGPGLTATAKGHEVVMSPYHALYFDYYQSPYIEGEPLGNKDINVPYLSLEQVYAYEPIPVMVTEEDARRVLGIQGQLWTEYMPSFAHVEYMAFPRGCALSEVAWAAKGMKDFRDFKARLIHHLGRLECQNVRYRPLKEFYQG